MGLDVKKTCLKGFENNKGPDQPAHSRSRISSFVIHLLESIISKLVTSEISIFWLVSVTEQAGLSLTLSETLKAGLVTSKPICESMWKWCSHENTVQSLYNAILGIHLMDKL